MPPSQSAATLRETTQAKFTCVECGFSVHADGVAAMNIKRAGLALLACGDTSPEVRASAGTTQRRHSCLGREPVGIPFLQEGEEVNVPDCESKISRVAG
jgi:hypothetical protein